MAEYHTRSGALAAAVGAANAINLNQAGVAQVLQVPSGVTAVKQIMVGKSASIVAVASAGVTLELVLSGGGMIGEQHIGIGGVREDTTSTGGVRFTAADVYNVDMPVKSGNPVDINCFMAGVDPGTPQVSITLVFA